jgi:hypothetical protein
LRAERLARGGALLRVLLPGVNRAHVCAAEPAAWDPATVPDVREDLAFVPCDGLGQERDERTTAMRLRPRGAR